MSPYTIGSLARVRCGVAVQKAVAYVWNARDSLANAGQFAWKWVGALGEHLVAIPRLFIFVGACAAGFAPPSSRNVPRSSSATSLLLSSSQWCACQSPHV